MKIQNPKKRRIIMSTKISILTVIVLLFSVCQLQAEDSTWIGGESSLWEDPINWEPTIIPDNNMVKTFKVTIFNNTSDKSFDIDLTQSHTIDILNCYGKVTLDNWVNDYLMLTVLDGITNYGNLYFSDINIKGNFINSEEGFLTLNGGIPHEINIVGGNLVNQFGGIVSVEGIIDVDEEEGVGGNIQNIGEIFCGAQLLADHCFYNNGNINLGNGLCAADDGFYNSTTTSHIEGFGFIHSDDIIDNILKLTD
jgi:hypothetical protein